MNEEFLKQCYDRNNFLSFVRWFIPDFVEEHQMVTPEREIFQEINVLGKGLKNSLVVIEIKTRKVKSNERVSITKEAFKVMFKRGFAQAIICFYAGGQSWRMSLLTTSTKFENGKIKREGSNPHRYSYYLGEKAKVRTPYKFLIEKGQVADLDDLKSRFSVEVVNKEFYAKVSDSFFSLSGGKVGKTEYSGLLKMSGTNEKKKIKEFAIRLIGRIMFCWFLKEKRSKNASTPLIDGQLLSRELIESSTNYYHDILEPLFFETLNRRQGSRRGVSRLNPLLKNVPYLNGGLFNAQEGDYYEYDDETGAGLYGELEIPNKWFVDLFEVLNTYNFTVDENTGFDVDLSIDPEMLGRIFENLLAEINPETEKSAKKSTGSFYTPREIVDYMVDQSLVNFLHQKTDIQKDVLNKLVSYNALDDDSISLNNDEKQAIVLSLSQITALDPACGSGAFPIGLLQKIVYILQIIDPEAEQWLKRQLVGATPEFEEDIKEKYDRGSYDYLRKLGIIRESIFGVDIQPLAIEITRLRCFLTLIVDEEIYDDKPNRGIRPLPNLDFKFVAADSLISLPDNDGQLNLWESNDKYVASLKRMRDQYFVASTDEKAELREKFIATQKKMSSHAWAIGGDRDNTPEHYKQLIDWEPFSNASSPWFDPEWMFGVGKFDIVIGNPPYISTKGVSAEYKKKFIEEFGFSDDLYNLFTFKGLNLCKPDGTLNYIVSKTFWTIQTKRNMRELILSKQINYIFDTANPFEAAMVDTCVIQVQNTAFAPNHKIEFRDGGEDLQNPKEFEPIEQETYLNAQNLVIFSPTDLNKRIYKKYNAKIKELNAKWWDKIKTSKDIEKNKKALEAYRQSLKPGDITLLGCLTEGGQGLATANNGKFIAIRKGTKWAEQVVESRPKKLAEALKGNKSLKIEGLENPKDTKVFLSKLSEKEIVTLFDSIKEKYGRDVFGQGYIYRLIDDNELADVDSLTEEEKSNGIDTCKNYYVPYDKGDKDGNRWYLETPFAIAWSKENVGFLKTDPKARYQGYTFFFREGFCWSGISDTRIRCRIKTKSVHDVQSMALFSEATICPDSYLICLICSEIIGNYIKTFINNTVIFQINDARQLPIIIPSQEVLANFKAIFDAAIELKKKANQTDNLNKLEKKLNTMVSELYQI